MATRTAQTHNRNGPYHHGDLRRDLLRFARGEIARGGASTVSLSSVARLAGVSQAAPYRHFKDRNALLEGVAEAGFQEFDEVLVKSGAGRAPREALQAMALAYLKYGSANIELYRVMFASRLVPKAKSGSPLANAADTAFGRLRHIMVGISPPEAIKRDAVSVWAQLHGLVMLRADGFVKQSLSQFLNPPHLTLDANTLQEVIATDPV